MPPLPNELLDLIFAHYEIDHTQYGTAPTPEFIDDTIIKLQTLASCCRASHLLRRFAEPLLYQTYVRGWVSASPSTGYTRKLEARHLSLRRHLRTIIQRPHLASNVRHVIIENWNIEPYPVSGYKRDNPQLKTLTQYVRDNTVNIPLYQDQSFNAGLICGNDDAEVTLLLSLLTGAVHLCISLVPISSFGVSSPSHVYDLLLRQALTPSQGARPFVPFQRLNTLTLIHFRGVSLVLRPAVPLKMISYFHLAPALKSIVLKDCVALPRTGDLLWFHVDDRGNFQYPRGPVEQVMLERCYVPDLQIINYLVKSCSTIRVFRYVARDLRMVKKKSSAFAAFKGQSTVRCQRSSHYTSTSIMHRRTTWSKMTVSTECMGSRPYVS